MTREKRDLFGRLCGFSRGLRWSHCPTVFRWRRPGSTRRRRFTHLFNFYRVWSVKDEELPTFHFGGHFNQGNIDQGCRHTLKHFKTELLVGHLSTIIAEIDL